MNDDKVEVAHLLEQAQQEITALRHQNVVLRARTDTFDAFMTVLMTRPVMRAEGSGEDLAGKIGQKLLELRRATPHEELQGILAKGLAAHEPALQPPAGRRSG